MQSRGYTPVFRQYTPRITGTTQRGPDPDQMEIARRNQMEIRRRMMNLYDLQMGENPEADTFGFDHRFRARPFDPRMDNITGTRVVNVPGYIVRRARRQARTALRRTRLPLTVRDQIARFVA